MWTLKLLFSYKKKTKNKRKIINLKSENRRRLHQLLNGRAFSSADFESKVIRIVKGLLTRIVDTTEFLIPFVGRKHFVILLSLDKYRTIITKICPRAGSAAK